MVTCRNVLLLNGLRQAQTDIRFHKCDLDSIL